MTAEPGDARRRRRLPRIVGEHPLGSAVVVLVAVTLVVRLAWGWQVGRQLAAQHAAARARGEPVTVAELVVAPLADERNARKLVEKAGGLDDQTTPQSTDEIYPSYPPFGDAWTAAAASSEQTNAQVFALMRQARGFDRMQLVAAYTSPIVAMRTPWVSHPRSAANTVTDGALLRHVRGDDAEAIERLRDVLHVGRMMSEGDDDVIAQLVANGLVALANDRAQVIAPGLRATDPAVRRAAAGLIADLLDDRHMAAGMRRAIVLSRVTWADYVATEVGRVWAIRPLADRLLLRHGARMDRMLRAIDAGSAEESRRIMGADPFTDGSAARRQSSTDAADHPMFWAKTPRYSRWFEEEAWFGTTLLEQVHKVVADRRATAVSVAAQLFRADRGRWPATLDELVPAYLPAVPVDPFRADRRPIGYVVVAGGQPGTGGDRPLVYFESGSQADVPLDVEPMYGWQSHPDKTLSRIPAVDVRQYRDLSRWAPAERRVDAEMREESERKKALAAALAAEEAEEAAEAARQAGDPAAATMPSTTQPAVTAPATTAPSP